MELTKKWAVNKTKENAEYLQEYAKRLSAGYWYHDGGALGTYLCEGIVGPVTSSEFWDRHYKISYNDWLNIPEVADALKLKLKMSTELKARFFALYWGQSILKRRGFEMSNFWTVSHNALYDIHYNVGDHVFNECYLVLRPLSSITDSEMIALFGPMLPADIYYFRCLLLDKPNDFEGYFEDFIKYTDWLRSKGFALPFMGISVEEMVEAGWIKLTE